MVHIAEDRQALVPRLQNRKAPPGDICTAPGSNYDDLIPLLPRPPAQAATSRQAKLQAIKAKRLAARETRDADAETAPGPDGDISASTPGDHDLRIASLKAKRSARSHQIVGAEGEILGSAPLPSQDFSGDKDVRYYTFEEGAEASGDMDSDRASRRERIQAMRTRCAPREQAARNRNAPWSDLLVAATASVDKQPDEARNTRSKVQRRMDHIRLSQAARLEDRQLLENRDACQDGNPQADRRQRPVLRAGHVEAEECIQPMQGKPRSTANAATVCIETEESMLPRASKPRPPTIFTDFDDGSLPVVNGKDLCSARVPVSTVTASETTKDSGVNTAEVAEPLNPMDSSTDPSGGCLITVGEEDVPSTELPAAMPPFHEQRRPETLAVLPLHEHRSSETLAAQGCFAACDLAESAGNEVVPQREECCVEASRVASTFTRFDGGEFLVIEDPSPDAESAHAGCEEDAMTDPPGVVTSSRTVANCDAVAWDVPLTRLAAGFFPLHGESSAPRPDIQSSCSHEVVEVIENEVLTDIGSCCDEPLEMLSTFVQFDGGERLVLGPECEENSEQVPSVSGKSVLPRFGDSDENIIAASESLLMPASFGFHPRPDCSAPNVEVDSCGLYLPVTSSAHQESMLRDEFPDVTPWDTCRAYADVVGETSLPQAPSAVVAKSSQEESSEDVTHLDGHASAEAARNTVLPSQHAAVLAKAAQQDVFEIPPCLQSALNETADESADMDHISEVSARRRAVLQKLREKREARSKQAQAMCDDPGEDGGLYLNSSMDGGEKANDTCTGRALCAQRGSRLLRTEEDAPVASFAGQECCQKAAEGQEVRQIPSCPESALPQSVEDTSDMNHISEVSARRRAALQKRAEQRGQQPARTKEEACASSCPGPDSCEKAADASAGCAQTSYADFRQAQRQGDDASAHGGCAMNSCASAELSSHDVCSSQLDDVARRRRIRQLQRERGFEVGQFGSLIKETLDDEDEDLSDRRVVEVLQRDPAGAPTKAVPCESVMDGVATTPDDWWRHVESTPDTGASAQALPLANVMERFTPDVWNNDDIAPLNSKKMVITGPDFFHLQGPELQLSKDLLMEHQSSAEMQLPELQLARPVRKKSITMASMGPPACEPSAKHLDNMWSRYSLHCTLPESDEVPDDDGLEELQRKWRHARGGITASDLRPALKKLLAPFDVRVDLGCSGRSQFSEGLPALAGETASARPSPSLENAAGALVLPSLKPTEKVRPTLDLLPKDRQRENCVQQ